MHWQLRPWFNTCGNHSAPKYLITWHIPDVGENFFFGWCLKLFYIFCMNIHIGNCSCHACFNRFCTRRNEREQDILWWNKKSVCAPSLCHSYLVLSRSAILILIISQRSSYRINHILFNWQNQNSYTQACGQFQKCLPQTFFGANCSGIWTIGIWSGDGGGGRSSLLLSC